MSFQRKSQGSYADDQVWARRFEPETVRVLAPYMPLLLADVFTVQHAGSAEDRACIGDLRIDVGSIHILSRVRDGKYHQRDLTLRSWRAGNVETEVAKILHGAGKWYFYGWAATRGPGFHEWMLIDLDIVRQRQTIEHYLHEEKRNADKTTGFIAIPRLSLQYDGAIRVQQIVKGGEPSIQVDSGVRYTAAESDAWLADPRNQRPRQWTAGNIATDEHAGWRHSDGTRNKAVGEPPPTARMRTNQ